MQKSVVDVQESAVTGQLVNSKEDNNSTPNRGLNEDQVGLKDPYTDEDEAPKKKGQFELAEETETSCAMNQSLIEYANKYVDIFISNQTLSYNNL